jgi:glycine/sarcosine N-methyltransferase
MSSPSDFYAEIASEYDRITRFAERLQGEQKTLGRWRERYGFNTALDAACGTGLHAIALSRLGVATIAADISAEMITAARRNADKQRDAGPNADSQGARLEFVQENMTRLADRLEGPFDAIFCLGNSLPHLERGGDLEGALSGFARLLAPSGVVVVQLINYAKVLATKERIMAVNADGATHYVRFYDFLGDRVRFNILTIKGPGEKPGYSLTSTILRPYRLPELSAALENAGFARLEAFGDMAFGGFEGLASANLVLAAQR